MLVTGAGGFIGSALFRVARDRGEEGLVGIDLDDADLTDEVATTTLLKELRPERIVHLAGLLAKGDDLSILEQQWRHTFYAGTVLLQCALSANVRHLIMAGTADELGDQAGALGPDVQAEPRSYYGLCKSLLRDYAAFFARQERFRVDWFRPFVVYGPGQQAGQMLIPTAFRAAKAGTRAAFSDGLQERDFIHVDDVVDWILRATRLPIAGGRLHVHHLGAGDAVAVRSVLEAIREEFPGSIFDIGALPRRQGEPSIQISARYQMREPPLDGWMARRPLREGIAETANWWRALEEA